ncbi:hypothetical protein GIB67_004908 [Kingdonia uniflora]|uniref:AAA+ ATPase domain-containing protein n=1 Tax=Kingdonia uniflora TaxID=39325 RepID=A0A7J7LNI9_9MAGN|nr:hypothetical protein GIB67_004908 [Kingdonia uniflora]
MLVRTIVNDLLPWEAKDYLFSTLRTIFNRLSSRHTIVIEEFNDLFINKIYEVAKTYLGTKVNRSMQRLKVRQLKGEMKLKILMDRNEEVIDMFQGVKLKWRFVCIPLQPLNSGLSHQKSINLNHPSTFDTIVMDFDLQNTLMSDLKKFVERKDMYKRAGKAWKREYLLYGPPGTGKSSLVAVMEKYLNFDVYDIDLIGVNSNSDLRRMLLAICNQSILVLEEIDCIIKFENQETEKDHKNQNGENKVTLFGVLNFIDGFWSSYGVEHIITFITISSVYSSRARLLKYRTQNSMGDRCNSFTKLAVNLLEQGEEMIDEDQLFILLKLFPSSYEHLKQIIICGKEALKFSKVSRILIFDEERKKLSVETDLAEGLVVRGRTKERKSRRYSSRSGKLLTAFDFIDAIVALEVKCLMISESDCFHVVDPIAAHNPEITRFDVDDVEYDVNCGWSSGDR